MSRYKEVRSKDSGETALDILEECLQGIYKARLKCHSIRPPEDADRSALNIVSSSTRKYIFRSSRAKHEADARRRPRRRGFTATSPRGRIKSAGSSRASAARRRAGKASDESNSPDNHRRTKLPQIRNARVSMNTRVGDSSDEADAGDPVESNALNLVIKSSDQTSGGDDQGRGRAAKVGLESEEIHQGSKATSIDRDRNPPFASHNAVPHKSNGPPRHPALSAPEKRASDALESLKSEIVAWSKKYPNKLPHDDSRDDYADYLTDKYLCQILDPLPPSAHISLLRKEATLLLEAFATQGTIPALSGAAPLKPPEVPPKTRLIEDDEDDLEDGDEGSVASESKFRRNMNAVKTFGKALDAGRSESRTSNESEKKQIQEQYEKFKKAQNKKSSPQGQGAAVASSASTVAPKKSSHNTSSKTTSVLGARDDDISKYQTNVDDIKSLLSSLQTAKVPSNEPVKQL